MLTIGISLLRVVSKPLLKTNSPSATARPPSCWEVNCSFGAIPYMTWCRHSLFWSRHFSQPARICSFPSLSNVGWMAFTAAGGKGSCLGQCVSSGHISVVAAPRIFSSWAVFMLGIGWGAGVMFQDGMHCLRHGSSIAFVVSDRHRNSARHQSVYLLVFPFPWFLFHHPTSFLKINIIQHRIVLDEHQVLR